MIKIKYAKPHTTFGSMKAGDTFEYNGHIFLTVVSPSGIICHINLTEARIHPNDRSDIRTTVTLVEIEANVTY